MVTSFLALAASKIAVKARSIWCVSTNVPEIMATPSTIESAVRIARSGRERRLASVSPSIGRLLQRLDLVEDLVRRHARAVRDDQPVVEEDDPVGDRGGARVV